LNFKSKTHEAQLEDQKPKKSSRRSSRRRKTHKTSKWHEKRQAKQNGKEELKKSQNHKKLTKLPLETDSQCKLSPLDRHYHVSSLNYPISQSSINFVHILSSFGNELIKHNPREASDAMHDIKIRVLHKVYK
jgi:hypothetical protein